MNLNKWPMSLALLTCLLGSTNASFAQTITTIATFAGSNGSEPYDSLIQGTDGSLYGTTSKGGTANLGTVFKIAPGGVLTVIHSFLGPDGSLPTGALLQASNGRLYGTTGGSDNNLGTIFEISTNGDFKLLHTFTGPDGAIPQTALIQATDGDLYGTTSSGGASGVTAGGTIFKISLAGELTTLFNFNPNNEGGYQPLGALLQAKDGDLYGTAGAGGAPNEFGGFGTIFKITLAGEYTVLHRFREFPGTPIYPKAALVQDSGGNLYGVTLSTWGNGEGTVYELNSSGLKTLHNFDGSDGSIPSGVLLSTDGKLYGTTQLGGANGFGTIFQIAPDGVFTSICSFNGADGESLIGSLLQMRDKVFVGTTYLGGANNLGTVYRLVTSQ